jgi:hypothetical protein
VEEMTIQDYSNLDWSFMANAFSALSGFFGSVLVYRYGVPSMVDTGGGGLVLTRSTEERRLKIERYKMVGHLGIGLIGLAFFLQFFALFL